MTTLLRAVIDGTGLSRRKAFAAIREGRVSLDGSAVTEPSAELAMGDLRMDGEPLTARPAARVYLMLNKPPDYLSTVSDERGRATVLDLVPADLRAPGLHPVGRLDRDTSGLLLLTNDGDLTFRLTHPSHEIEKEYWLRLAEPATEEQLARLRHGVELDGARRRPLRLSPVATDGRFDFSMTLREGRNRQVRRMLEAVGARVTALRRVREGPLTLDGLPEGGVRRLTREEVHALREG